MTRGLPVVAIVGRPNVGKSTFFNRVLGERRAIVQDVPGVTRDRNFARADWAGRGFWVVDTGGLEFDASESMPTEIRRQVMAAIEEADLIVFLVDGKTGPHPVDHRVAELLRKTDLPILVAVNKMDRWPEDLSHLDFWELGLGEPVPVSAMIGKGSGDLLDVIVEKLPPVDPTEGDDALYVAVIGKPNVGKSSFVNRLLGENRMVVNAEAGTTRDPVDTPIRFHGQEYVFIDTAGLRRQARVEEALEYYSTLRTERAIERADVCLLLIDATEPMAIQDLRIAEKAWKSGCAMIIVANKWDLVKKETMTADTYAKELRSRAPSLRHVPVLFSSALTGQRVQKVLEMIQQVAAERSKRIPTREVTLRIRKLAERQPPPHFRGNVVKLQYATQVAVKPPIFVIFSNHPKAIPDHYVRYLLNGIREAWAFHGTPIRIRFRGRKDRKKEGELT
jgi:GTPase